MRAWRVVNLIFFQSEWGTAFCSGDIVNGAASSPSRFWFVGEDRSDSGGMTADRFQRMQLSRLRGGLRRASAQAAFVVRRRSLFPKSGSCCPVDAPARPARRSTRQDSGEVFMRIHRAALLAVLLASPAAGAHAQAQAHACDRRCLLHTLTEYTEAIGDNSIARLKLSPKVRTTFNGVETPLGK